MAKIKWKDLKTKLCPNKGMNYEIQKALIKEKEVKKYYSKVEDINWNDFIWNDNDEYSKSEISQPTTKDFDTFLAALAWQESKGIIDPYSVVNGLGFIGKYQMGAPALESIGFINEKTKKWMQNTKKEQEYYLNLKNNKINFERENSKGEIIHDDWYKEWYKYIIGNKDLQEEGIKRLLLYNWQYIKNNKLDKYIGEIIQGVKITVSGMLGGAHLCGVKNVKKFLKSGNVTSDGNKTPITKYMIRMSGFDLTDLLGYNPDDFKYKNMVFLYKIAESSEYISRIIPKFHGYNTGNYKEIEQLNVINKGNYVIVSNVPVDENNNMLSFNYLSDKKEIKTYDVKSIKMYNGDLDFLSGDIDFYNINFFDEDERKKLNTALGNIINPGEAIPLYYTVKNGRYTNLDEVSILERITPKRKVAYRYKKEDSLLETYEKLIKFEKGKTSIELATEINKNNLKENELVYISANEEVYFKLVTEMIGQEEPEGNMNTVARKKATEHNTNTDNATQEEIVTYFTERVGRELDNGSREVLIKMLENFNKLKDGNYSYILKQSKFDLLREGTDALKLKDLLGYMLSFTSDKMKSLKLMSIIFEGIERNQLSGIDIGELAEKPEEDFYCKLLKEYEGDKLRPTYTTDNKKARMILDFLLIEYIKKRFNCKIDRVLKNMLLFYHKDKELTVHGKGMYEKIRTIAESNSNKVDVFNFITSYDDDKLEAHIEYMNTALSVIKIRDDRDYLFYFKIPYEEDNEAIGDDRLNDLDMTMELARSYSGNKDCISFIESL